MKKYEVKFISDDSLGDALNLMDKEYDIVHIEKAFESKKETNAVPAIYFLVVFNIRPIRKPKPPKDEIIVQDNPQNPMLGKMKYYPQAGFHYEGPSKQVKVEKDGQYMTIKVGEVPE